MDFKRNASGSAEVSWPLQTWVAREPGMAAENQKMDLQHCPLSQKHASFVCGKLTRTFQHKLFQGVAL